MDPCAYCFAYPRQCENMCEDKRQYINEFDEDTKVVKRQPWKKKRVFSNQYNKNGIRRS
ncbi:hypothetical protein Clole_2790 [Cellulosilyticum lentocellum DSM 5427]|uniref:Uncharacterized protein n=1 Tax=Cellulosilyticum lentocellum (strain ATCC 49066 / DSM 5427 / NCIMB 11756 / RHM5) TaxID=642492 RepID=F2JK74_CELLD|nr:hypothetical protein Clole_2790 [Cellulosilyticum lentocellum DSM 5427]